MREVKKITTYHNNSNDDDDDDDNNNNNKTVVLQNTTCSSKPFLFITLSLKMAKLASRNIQLFLTFKNKVTFPWNTIILLLLLLLTYDL